MKATLAVAFAYFSFLGLQKWLNWIFGPLLAVGLVMELRAASSYSLGHGMALGTLAAIVVAMAPIFAGGMVMRIASSPTVLHLRPQGRRHMLAGATLAMALAALLISLPTIVAQITGIGLPGRSTGFDNPGLSIFQIAWGGVALTWITVLVLSRYQMLVAFSCLLVVLIANLIVPFASRSPITADWFATIVFVTGAAAWIAFARWYLRTPSLARPGLLPGLPGGKSAPHPARPTEWRGFMPFLSARKGESRAIALRHFLTGTDSERAKVLFGALMAILLVAQHLSGGVPTRVAQLSGFFFIASITAAIPIVRRSRLLWLRAGLNRNDLFLTAERQAWRTLLAFWGLPVIFFLVLAATLTQAKALTVLLLVSLQLAFSGCLLYTGLAITRERPAVLVLLFPCALLWIFVDPETNFSRSALCVALAVVGTMAIGLRAYARRNWRVLDWRLSGSPLPSQGWRGT